MSNRTVRVNELVQRELSEILRKRYQSEAVAITISGVEVSPDLHDGKIFVAVTGEPDFAQQKVRWLRDILPQLKQELGRRIVLKWMPAFTVVLDESTARGNRLLQILDEISAKENPAPDQKAE
ncbi:MAG TPA: 30S ribosome-binding factor RbfA [Opitutaceae bacterium]|nr:30S ribosome-binding factor RbfA [Opitutaceae bacterium]